MLSAFFLSHWIASVFFQSFFHHRYAAHRMYTVTPRTEPVLHLMVPYFLLATHWWQWALLPIQWILGPIHGAIVNWCGHKYGYRNFQNGDASCNTLVFDVVTMGELFQNNHHKYPMSPDFAARWFEIDPTWQVMRILAQTRVIEIATPQRAVLRGPATATAP